MRTVRYFDGKTYKWVGLSRQPNIIGKVSLALISSQRKKKSSIRSVLLIVGNAIPQL